MMLASAAPHPRKLVSGVMFPTPFFHSSSFRWRGPLGVPNSGGVSHHSGGLSNRHGVPGVPGEEISSNAECFPIINTPIHGGVKRAELPQPFSTVSRRQAASERETVENAYRAPR
jgi:hypothetical protein